MVDRLCTSLAGLSLSAIRRYTALAAEREDCITLTIGEPDLPTPAPICEAAVRALAGGSTHYTANQGSASLRAKIATYEAKRAILIMPRTRLLSLPVQRKPFTVP